MIRTPAARSVFSRKFVIWRESGGRPTLPFVKQTEGAPSFAFFCEGWVPLTCALGSYRLSDRLKLWRRVRDSNPRYPSGYAGFQDRCHQPLGQLSGLYSFTTLSTLGLMQRELRKREGGQIKEAVLLNRGDRRKRPSSHEETTCLEQSPTVFAEI